MTIDLMRRKGLGGLVGKVYAFGYAFGHFEIIR
jgi:hypothetical protein